MRWEGVCNQSEMAPPRTMNERKVMVYDSARLWGRLKFYACARYLHSVDNTDAAELMISTFGEWVSEIGTAMRRRCTRARVSDGVWRYSIDRDGWRNAVSADDDEIVKRMKDLYRVNFSDCLLQDESDADTEPYNSDREDLDVIFNI